MSARPIYCPDCGAALLGEHLRGCAVGEALKPVRQLAEAAIALDECTVAAFMQTDNARRARQRLGKALRALGIES